MAGVESMIVEEKVAPSRAVDREKVELRLEINFNFNNFSFSRLVHFYCEYFALQPVVITAWVNILRETRHQMSSK